MTCKDCICSEVCYYKSFNDVRNLKKRRDDVEKICKSFVNRDSVKVDAVEVVHGRWIVENEEGIRCSECCFNRAIIKMPMDYCPNCGAKMDGDGNA